MGTSAAESELLSVALIAKVAADLARTCERSKLSPTDIVNRAISLYEFLDEQRASGAEMQLRRPDGSTYSISLT